MAFSSSGAASGAAGGALAGSQILPGWGTVIGGVAGGLLGGFAGGGGGESISPELRELLEKQGLLADFNLEQMQQEAALFDPVRRQQVNQNLAIIRGDPTALGNAQFSAGVEGVNRAFGQAGRNIKAGSAGFGRAGSGFVQSDLANLERGRAGAIGGVRGNITAAAQNRQLSLLRGDRTAQFGGIAGNILSSAGGTLGRLASSNFADFQRRIVPTQFGLDLLGGGLNFAGNFAGAGGGRKPITGVLPQTVRA